MGILALALGWLFIVALAGCGREFENPFLPGSPDYAGTAWSRDGDGDGVADSVEKYAPGCAGGPRECLQQALAKAAEAGKPVPVVAVAVEDMVFILGETEVPMQRRPPVMRWKPENASNKTYSLYSANNKVARIVGDSVQAGQLGETTVTLLSEEGSRQADFRVQVCERDLLLTLRCGGA